ncbi:MAG: SIMPL domain-containing protein [Croceimicrobium sp.]
MKMLVECARVIKPLVRRSLMVLLLCLFTSQVIGQIEQNHPAQLPYIEVVGDASLSVFPDKILIEVTLVEKGKSEAKEPIKVQEKKLIEGLARLDIPNDRLSKEGARTDYVKISWFSEKQISKSVYILELKNAKEITAAFSLFAELNVEHAILYESTHSQLDSLRQEVEVKAVLDAKARAEKLLTAIGSEVGEPLLITQNQNNHGEVYFIDGVKVRGSVQIPQIAYEAPFIEKEPVINVQKIKIEASILARFKIK